MPRNQLTKDELRVKILNLRKRLDEGNIGVNWSEDQKYSARHILNQVLDIIDEYRY